MNDETSESPTPKSEPPEGRYGMTGRNVALAEAFFASLREFGRLRLACAEVGWSRKQIQCWNQRTQADGTPNRLYNPEFSRGVEAAICKFQSKVIARLMDDSEDQSAARWRCPAWVLERFFGAEYSRRTPAAEKRNGLPAIRPQLALNPPKQGMIVTLEMQERLQAAQREFLTQEEENKKQQNENQNAGK